MVRGTSVTAPEAVMYVPLGGHWAVTGLCEGSEGLMSAVRTVTGAVRALTDNGIRAGACRSRSKEGRESGPCRDVSFIER